MRKACVIGHPIGHSRSPLIHAHWLQRFGIEGVYATRDIAPEAFPTFLKMAEGEGYVGGNATLPHKTSLFALAEQCSADARAVGAANTFWFEHGAVCVDNTDIHGFLANLDAGAPDWDTGTETAMVLGAGGASRAIVYGLIKRGVERVIVANRTLATAEELRRDFGKVVAPVEWSDAPRLFADVDVLVNSTSLGMAGQGVLDLSLAGLPSHAVVTDAVYVPLETELLARARLRGLRTVGGLGMLLHQAVPGFERWFGRRPQVTAELTDLVSADISQRH
ncbi:MAG: shikimate dehydrogenase [Beijerinckiaceae bacterium]